MSGMIGVDWGTTNLRAWLFDGGGNIVDVRREPVGVARIRDGDFATALDAVIHDWLSDDRLVVLGGMVGSRQGWAEAPYLGCPVTPDILADAARPVDFAGRRAWIVPGLHCRTFDGLEEVMRGEELQILGAAVSEGTAILPGTHSKWARIEDGEVRSFGTFMTGELYELLRNHSFLARSMESGGADPAAFVLGARRAITQPGIPGLLFSVRTEGLFGNIAPTSLPDYLSGLLIGAEIADAAPSPDSPVTIIGERALVDRYRMALEIAGVERVFDADGGATAAAGLKRIGECLKRSKS